MSKKIISIILVVIMLVSAMCISVSAATGKAGNYYYTDIKSYVRGKLIDSYNVGGKTVILVEALRTYGFNVDWDGNARTLTITDTKGTATSSATAAANGAIGAVMSGSGPTVFGIFPDYETAKASHDSFYYQFREVYIVSTVWK